MSTTQPAPRTPRTRGPWQRWVTPAFGVSMGLVFLAAGWMSGHPGLGVEMMAVMFVFTLGLVLAAQRSETVRGLLDRSDERITTIDVHATAIAGTAVITAVIV